MRLRPTLCPRHRPSRVTVRAFVWGILGVGLLSAACAPADGASGGPDVFPDDVVGLDFLDLNTRRDLPPREVFPDDIAGLDFLDWNTPREVDADAPAAPDDGAASETTPAEISDAGDAVRPDAPDLDWADLPDRTADAVADVVPDVAPDAVPDAADGADSADGADAADGAGPPPSLRFHERVSGPDDVPAWRSDMLTFYRGVLDLGPVPDWPLEPVVRESERLHDGLVRHLIEYSAPDGERIPAYLFVPDTAAPVPAVLFYHGHGLGKVTSVEDVGGAENALARDIAQGLGYVVLAPDTRSFGEFLVGGLDHPRYVRALEAEGRLFTSLAVADGLADLRLLASLREVDLGAVAVAGISGGCWRALNVSAHTQWPAATVCAGLFISWDYLFGPHHCPCQHAPGLAERTAMPDLGALLVPRAVMLQWGLDDPFYEQGAPEAGDELRRAYEVVGVPEAFAFDVHEDLGHRFDNPSVIGWLFERFGAGAWPPAVDVE